MKTLEITETPSLAATFFRALGTGAKRPGLIKSLPKVELVLPEVVLRNEHIARYAALCGFKATDGVPMIYPQLLTFPLVTAYVSSQDCPWPAMGTVHLANAITQHQALHANDTVRVELEAGELFATTRGKSSRLSFASCARTNWCGAPHRVCCASGSNKRPARRI